MLKLNTEITLTQQNRTNNKTFVFDYCTNIQIETSWDLFTDTATIILPNRFTIKNKENTLIVGADSIFKRGDKITIKQGYDTNLNTAFIGYVSKVKPNSPVTVMCEDTMWLLKQRNISSKSWLNPTIKEVVEYCLGDLDIDVDYSDEDIKLGELVIDNRNTLNIVSVLSKLKGLGIFSFFIGETLKIGLLSEIRSKIGSTYNFSFEKNIISDSLDYIREDDVNLVIHGISYQNNNTKIERWGAINSVGVFEVLSTVQQGETRTIHFNSNLTAVEVKEAIIRDRYLYIYEGFKGSFTTFGEPFVTTIDVVKLINPRITDQNGEYIIRKVTREHGVNGSRQTIELQAKIG